MIPCRVSSLKANNNGPASALQNAERLRATGRVEEAEEFEIQAQNLDDACDKQWRTRVEQSIVSR